MRTNIASLDSEETLGAHRKIIKSNKLLNSIYHDFYRQIKDVGLPRTTIEIGSGAGFIKQVIPSVITTDVVPGQGIDKIAFAEKLQFRKNSVGSFVMLNVFHHIKNPVKALKEFGRCLKRGGKIAMIEPSASPWARFIYKNFHHENFDTSAGWRISGKGRLSDANGALPWIVFIRDQKKFCQKFPNLKIISIKEHTPFAYLLSGGLSGFSLFSGLDYKFIKSIEKKLLKFSNSLSMFMTIVIEKQ